MSGELVPDGQGQRFNSGRVGQFDPAERLVARERAAEMFTRGDRIIDVAVELGISSRRAQLWRSQMIGTRPRKEFVVTPGGLGDQVRTDEERRRASVPVTMVDRAETVTATREAAHAIGIKTIETTFRERYAMPAGTRFRWRPGTMGRDETPVYRARVEWIECYNGKGERIV